jgi:drug/metabolite transporter (DMT)-like permease
LAFLSYVIPLLIWGTAWTAIRISIQPGAYLPLEGVAVRFTGATVIAALIWFVWSRFSKEKVTFTPPLLWSLFWSGLFGSIAYCFLYLAESQISGGLAAVIASTETFFVGLMLLLTHHDKISKWFWIGSIISMFGIAIVFHNRMQVSSDQTMAMLQTLFVAVMFAGETVALKEPSKAIHPIPLLTVFSLFSVLPIWLFIFIRGIHPIPMNPPLDALIAMGYLVVMASVVAFLLFFVALKTIGVHQSSTMVLLIPIISLATDYFFEKRMFLDFEAYVGITVVLAGVALCLMPSKDPDHTVQPIDEIIVHE